MNDIPENWNELGDNAIEKELIDIFNSMDDDLVNQQIDNILAERGECVNMDSIKEKAVNRLEKGKKRRDIAKGITVVAAVATLTVSTVYAKDIKQAFQSFFGKSTIYQTVVDGDAYYLPEKLVLSDNYALRHASMSEGTLEIYVESTEDRSDDWYEGIELTISEPGGGKSYEGGGYGYFDDALGVFFYEMPTLEKFDITIEGEVYPVTLTKAETLVVDENLVIGVPESQQEVESTDVNKTEKTETAMIENMPLIANIAASRNDEGSGVGISIVVGFDDRNLKLNALGEETATTFNQRFENVGGGIVGSSNGSQTNPLIAYDAEGSAYELKEPANVVRRPVTVFETDAALGTPLQLKVAAIVAHYEKEVDRIKLSIPENGEIEVGQEVDFAIQKAMVNTIKRTSETTAEIVFDLNTGADKSVKIRDISAYSKNVIKGETVVTGNTAVLTITFDKDIEEAEIEFSWPYFTIEGNWSIDL